MTNKKKLTGTKRAKAKKASCMTDRQMVKYLAKKSDTEIEYEGIDEGISAIELKNDYSGGLIYFCFDDEDNITEIFFC